jgi:hypothetical protein
MLHPENIEEGGPESPAMLRAPHGQVLDYAGDADALEGDLGPLGHDGDDEAGEIEMMDDDTFLSRLEAEERAALDYMANGLSADRAEALDYFFREPFGNEEDGRSQVVTSDVMDAIEGMLPGLLKPFVSSDEVMKFTPSSAKDVKQAEQEGDYLNHVFMQKNDGFSILYKWAFDGLSQKNGYVKYYWDTVQRVSIERYEGLTDNQLALMFMSYPDLEVVKHSAYPDPQQASMPAAEAMQGMQPPQLHDLVLRHRPGYGCARIVNIPAEEFLISADAVDANPKLAKFCEHRRKMTLSALRQMLPDVEIPDDIEDAKDDSVDASPERMARLRGDITGITSAGEGAMREVMVREMYPLIDRDGDGIAERRQVILVGDSILMDEEVEEPPFSGWTPYIIPHRAFGLSVADLTINDQLIKSTLTRQALDNIYGINNNRLAVSKKVDLDDLLENPINGIVRVDASDAVGNHVMPMPVQPIGMHILPLIEHFDSAKESRTGVTRYNQGLDADSLNKTKGGIQLIQQAGHERLELISRVFAETGLKDLMVSLHGLVRRNSTKADTVRLRNQWVDVDPRDWTTRNDMTVSVGLGTGDKQMAAQNAMAILQAQKEAMAAGLSSPPKLYNGLVRFTQSMGFKDPNEFWNDPTAPDFQAPPQNKPIEVQVAEVNAQAMVGATRVQQEGKQAEVAAKDVQHQRETQRQATFDTYKANLDAHTRIRERLIDVAAKAITAMVSANDGNPRNGEAGGGAAGFDTSSWLQQMEQILMSEHDEGSKLGMIQQVAQMARRPQLQGAQ